MEVRKKMEEYEREREEKEDVVDNLEGGRERSSKEEED